MGNSLFVALFFVLGAACAPPVSSSDEESGPNVIVSKAFGFMLFGNDGFTNAGVENLNVRLSGFI